MEFLDARLVREYEENGFVVIRNAFSNKACEALLKEIEAIMGGWDLEEMRKASKPFVTYDQSNRSSDEWFLTSGDEVRPFFEEEGDRPIFNKIGHALHELNPLFRGLVRHRKITDVLRKLKYESPVCVQSMYIAKSAKVGGEVTAHQDSTFLVTNPFSVCGVWMALKRATVDNGCMFFVPGSHKRQPIDRLFLRDPSDFGRTVFQPNDPPPYNVEGAVSVEANQGDLVIFHGSVVHFSAPNRSNIHRPAYVMHFTESKCGWHPRNWLQSRYFTPIYGPMVPFHPPAIDISDIYSRDVQRAWDFAMIQYGFAVVTSRLISADTVASIRTKMKQYFGKPLPEKLAYKASKYGQTGYNAIGHEAVTDIDKDDTVEGKKSHTRKPADPLESYYFSGDILPGHAPEDLVTAAREYRKALDEHLLRPILRLSALALGLGDIDALVRAHGNRPSASLKLSHYVPTCLDHRGVSRMDDNGLRYGAHTDWEGFTILLQDEMDDYQNGLEALVRGSVSPSGKPQWMPIGCSRASEEIAFVVNAGDFVPIWTGGRWHSPVHRVVMRDKNRDRYTIPYFTGPDLSSTVESLLPNYFDDGEASEHHGLVAGDWLELRRKQAQQASPPSKL